MIDPLAKLNRPKRKRSNLKSIRKKPRKAGPITQAEKLIVAELVQDAPLNLMSDEKISMTAELMRRSPDVIKSIVVQAREQLQSNALSYVASHRKSVEQALAAQDFDIARKGSEWAIEHISARDADGKVERIVEKVEAESTAPRVMIGIQLGGLRDKQ